MNKRYCKYCKREIVNAACNQQYHTECQILHARYIHKIRVNKKYKDCRYLLLELKVNGCAICGYSKCPAALEFHRVNPQDKSFNVAMGAARGKSYKNIINEVNKCILLCSNCHRELHYYGKTVKIASHSISFSNMFI